jgi:eukaryotic-like serine/threonine-protein kinase
MSHTTVPVPLTVGPYELVEHVASGGMAEVYVARRRGPRGFHKTVAVKRILPQLVQDEEFVAMFVNEARVAATLSHPNVVQVFDFGEANGELYMAMEYVRGTNVARLTRRATGRGTVIPLEVCLHIVLSVLRGLEYAHNAKDEKGQLLHLVHRDVSPSNVLIDESGAVKLTDFGIARAATVERRTVVGHLKGKLGYMSPEQVMGQELDARSDLFTLGIVMAELLTLRPLFAGPSEIEILTQIRDADIRAIRDAFVPAEVLSVLRRALARLPELRYESARAFADDVEALAHKRGLSLGAPRVAAWINAMIEGSHYPPEVHDAATSMVPDVPRPPKRPHLVELEGDSEAEDTPALAAYRVELPDRSVKGPFHYHQLAELFATGVASSACRISKDGGEMAPAKQFPELLRLVTSVEPWGTDAAWLATDKRQIDRRILPAWLFRLAALRETGAVLIKDSARRKRVFLIEGIPEFSLPNDRGELLGEYLIAQRGVLRVEVEMAMSILPRFGGRLGDALVGLGVLRPIELFRAIHDQIQERFTEIFTWGGGDIGFARGARSHEETFPLGVDPYELIARGVRHGYSFEELQAMLQPVLEEVIEPVLLPPVRIEQFRLPERDAFVLDSIEGKTTIARVMAELTSKGEADPEEVLRAIFLGLCCEIVRSPKWVVPPSIPSKRGSGAYPRES